MKNESPLRPVIKRADEINKIADKLNSTPTAVANYCVNIFIDVCNEALPKIESEFKQALLNISKKIPR